MIVKPRLGVQLIKGHWASRGLVGCWLAGHGGNMALDLSGNGNHGTFQGDTHLVPGKFGQAWNFDGDGDYVDTQWDAADELSNLTVSAWVKNVSTAQGQRYVVDHSDGGGFAIRLNRASNSYDAFVYYDSGSLAGVLTTGNLATGIYDRHHVAMAYSSSGCYLYLDGVEVDSTSGADNIDSSGGTLHIGSTYNGIELFSGTIDNVMIFDRALSAAEIRQLYLHPFCMFGRS